MQQSLFVHESGLSSAKGIPIYSVKLVREGHTHYGTLRHSQHAEGIIQSYLGDADREHFVVLLLDRKNNVIGINTVAVGSLSATVVHPREVLCAVLCGVVSPFQTGRTWRNCSRVNGLPGGETQRGQ